MWVGCRSARPMGAVILKAGGPNPEAPAPETWRAMGITANFWTLGSGSVRISPNVVLEGIRIQGSEVEGGSPEGLREFEARAAYKN